MQFGFSALVLSILLLTSCASTHDIAHYPFPEAQAQLRAVLQEIVDDSATGNVTGLRDSHLKTDKFTKFGGRVYERMNFKQTTEDETSSRLSVQNYKNEPKDVKIDVFGDFAVMTYYPQVQAVKDGKTIRYSSRQTLVFLKTANGRKIVHEHQSRKEYEE